MFGGSITGSGGIFGLLAPGTDIAFLFGASGSVPVFAYNRWWTLLSAGWLHGSVLHILFNMMWVRQLGPATADIYGAGRMVIIYTVASAAGFFLSSLAGFVMPPLPIIGGARLTLGASAAIFGLLGALVYYGRRGGSSMVHREAMGYAMALFVMGLILPGVDNYAHAGGFAGGYVAGMWMDPLKPERMDHFIGAALCIVLTGLAIIASIITALV
jgi:rhomboid protease GluP